MCVKERAKEEEKVCVCKREEERESGGKRKYVGERVRERKGEKESVCVSV